jgi:predicted nucleotidyltransferase
MGMNVALEHKLGAVLSLCAKHRVARLEIFGSATRGRFDPAASDLDFLVEFKDMPPGDHAHAYFGLLRDLKRLFNRDIDLVETRAIDNPYFLESINKSRTLLYAA